MRALFDQKERCDCCGKKLYHRYDGRKFGYVAYTTEGVKVLCSSCKTKYNILDRLPQGNELRACEYNMKGFSFRGEWRPWERKEHKHG